MTDSFPRRLGAERNELTRSMGALLGIAQGLLCDGQISDQEIAFLHDWLVSNDAIAAQWPGDALLARVRQVLADGQITAEEREHLAVTLQQLIGGSPEELAGARHVTELALDRDAAVEFAGAVFCLTGDFVFAPRKHCEAAISSRGGIVSGSVTRKLNYLVVGGLGSKEWKHGSFGTKVEKAIEFRRAGQRLFIVHEDQWAAVL